jgi:tRNA (guanine-N7-)-methyltransferase
VSLPIEIAVGGRRRLLAELAAPLPLAELVPGQGPWEVELGFGKGRYLLGRALAEPAGRFLGVEMASRYYRLLVGRAARRGAANLVAVRGEALAVLATVLPRHFARAVHVYFPDPWPKARHHRRRLFDPESVDLVLALLAPGGRLHFASDFQAYGELVAEEPWPDGARTNYEAKYMAEGRPIVRLVAELRPGESPGLHPQGARGVVGGYRAGAEAAAAARAGAP